MSYSEGKKLDTDKARLNYFLERYVETKKMLRFVNTFFENIFAVSQPILQKLKNLKEKKVLKKMGLEDEFNSLNKSIISINRSIMRTRDNYLNSSKRFKTDLKRRGM